MSFAAAALAYGLLNAGVLRAGRAQVPAWRLCLRWLTVAGMALFLRGGVLVEATQSWGWPPAGAIALAALSSAVVVCWAAPWVSARALDADPARLAAGIVIYAFVLRLFYAGAVELLPEETYYWNYAQHLDLGYLDHPPMVAWLITLGVHVWGNTPFAVRSAALFCAAIAAVFVRGLARNLFGARDGRCALILAQALPFFFLAGFVTTPDAPLTAAWAATMYYLERALIAERRHAWWGVGISLGLGMISKYSIALLVPVIALFMLLDAPSRRWWRRPEPYAAAAVALALFSPVIVWNAHHEWASFAFQTSRRLAEVPRFALHKLIASALVLITPIGVAAIVVALRRAGAELAPGDRIDTPDGEARRWRFLRIAVLFPLAVFTAFSLRHEVKLDWTGAPWVAGLPLMAATMARGARGMSARIRAAWLPTLGTLLLIYGAGLHYLALGWPGLSYPRHIELVPVAWRDFSTQIAEIAADIRARTGREPVVVGMDRYAIASEMEFNSVAKTQRAIHPSSAHLFGGIGLMYERWSPAASHEGDTLLLVAWDPKDLESPAVPAHCARLDPVMDGVLKRDGTVVRHYYYRVAYNYRSRPGE